MSVMPLEDSGEWLEAAGFAGWLAKPIRVGTFPDQVRSTAPEGNRASVRDAVLPR